jgi:hypothetical protein
MRDRSVEALVRLTIQVARDGKVSSIVGASIGADRALVDCTLEVAATGNFSAPQGGSAAIQVPLTFVKR